MTKKGPLGKAELHYIDSFYKEKTAKEIAKDLDRAIGSIKKQIVKVEEQAQKPLTAGQQFARRDGVVMMTESAAMLSDATKKTSDNKKRDCISRIKTDE
tara:strand:- start:14737 stop:15033 length:297 start_codon:yes stop_codon:yes gene_type:complete